MSAERSRLFGRLHAAARCAATPHAAGAVAVLVSAVMLLAKLDDFPAFVDEAVYARWALRLAESPSAETLWLSTHEDWKTPAFIWVLASTKRWLDDPILTGRLITSLSGLLTVALVFHAGSRLVGAWPAAIAAAVTAVSPALVFTSRLALTDGLIVMLTALVWALSARAARGRLPHALGAGLVVALALWTKVSGALLLIIPAVGIMLVARLALWRRALTLAACIVPPSVAGIAFLLAPKSAQTFEHARGFVLTPDRLVAVPVGQWADNLSQMGGWALAYLPAVSIVAAIAGLALPLVTRRRDDWWLWAVLVIWLGFHIVFGARLYSRYALPALVPLALLTARTIAVIGTALRQANQGHAASLWMVGATFAVLLSLAVPALVVIVAPTRAALSSDDRAQYIEEWSSGFGQTEALQWIAEATAAEPGPAIVLTNHVYGAPRDLAVLTLRNRPDVATHVETRIRHPAGGVADAWRRHGVPVYALINGNQDDEATFLHLNPEFTPVAEFERPGAKTKVSVLEFSPS
ncbi:MAG: glycosyltransferase family 39 protein [Chloroflexi bacterium]|nr:glycosyltransferase family 39 protein [Chloroflexota bacterium]